MFVRAQRRRLVASALIVLALAGSACSRSSDDDPEVGTGDTSTTAPSDTATTGGEGEGSTTTAPAATGGLDNGGFGDLENVCQDGDASGATDTGVTDDSINIGSFTDKGFTARPGLNEEMFDAAVAFANWCNEHGGILGREIVVNDRDAALTDYNARIIESCSEDFAMVGGGNVLDDADNGGRIQCGLPNIAGYVVSAVAREAELQVQPLPNPLTTVSGGIYGRVAEDHPDLIGGYGTITSSFGSVLLTRDIAHSAAEQAGFTVVYDEEYNSQGESNWRPFVESMQSAGVTVLEFIGEPTFFTQLLEAMDQVGYRPDLMLVTANFYDTLFAETAGDIAQNVKIRTQFTPFELADTNPATQDYLDLMAEYNPGGKVALLGAQSVSAFLLFAQAATACGSDLTRVCLMEQASTVTEWTGGGMHAPQDPSGNLPSPCFVVLDMSTDGFTVDSDLTQADDGIFNCNPDNVIDVG